MWGIGELCCEFFYVDDVVDVLVFLMKYYDVFELINVGCGIDLIICELVEIIVEVVGFFGEFIFDIDKLDGILCKFMDVS